jgi:hypothetical protein
MLMRSCEIYAQLSPYLKKLVANTRGVCVKTVESWCRPAASDTDPYGSGKQNPLDAQEREMRIIFKYDPALARQIPEYLFSVYDQLTGARGFTEVYEEDDDIARLTSEFADVIKARLANKSDDEKLKELIELDVVLDSMIAKMRAQIGAPVN